MFRLVNVKEKLVEIISSKQYDTYDYEQLEYLIQLIDWTITGKISLGTETIKIIMEEIIITSVHQLNLDLLDTLQDLKEIKEELHV